MVSAAYTLFLAIAIFGDERGGRRHDFACCCCTCACAVLRPGWVMMVAYFDSWVETLLESAIQVRCATADIEPARQVGIGRRYAISDTPVHRLPHCSSNVSAWFGMGAEK